ncbi:MAG TPA: DegT/DnrJ/EryC1/StrS family aminotransferase [Polyangiales bacterium]|nr:DegT/DnrJ/EryC1/StrS family aminotransferase [Polyangiales bacterium]
MRAVPYVDLVKQNASLRSQIAEAVDRVIRHGHFTNGPEVEQFESALATELGIENVIGVGSGTAALTLVMRAFDIGPGDEVITVAHSYVATASAILLVGATPVFVDVDPDTALMDPKLLLNKLTPRTKAIVPVHLGGVACDLEPIERFCAARDLHLIEDCAQAIGATYQGRSVGSVGTGCFSLHPLKSLAACGDGGFITTNDSELAALLRKLRTLGHRDRDHVDYISENARLDTLQAAILNVKLPHLNDWIGARRNHGAVYQRALARYFELTSITESCEPAFSAFVLRHDARDELLSHLADHGFDAKVHYPIPIHKQRAFASLAPVSLPHTESLARRILSLPVSPELDPMDRDALVDVLIAWSKARESS